MENQKDKTSLFLNELLIWNKRINLVSKRDENVLFDRHVNDSLKALPYIPENTRLLDIGSGNGFPAIPIAINRPSVCVYALEAREKRAVFLKHIKTQLSLENLNILNLRAESNPVALQTTFDIITSRAFSSIKTFVNLGLFYAKEKAVFIYYNSLNNNDKTDLSTFRGIVINTVDSCVYKLGDNKTRTLTVINLLKRNDL